MSQAFWNSSLGVGGWTKQAVVDELEGLGKKVEPESGQAEFSGFSEGPSVFISPLFSPRHAHHTPSHRLWPSRAWHAVIREGSFGRILIYSAFHSSMGLCSVPGPVLNPRESKTRPSPCLRAGEGGPWALRRIQCSLIRAMHSFARSAKTCQAPATYQAAF